MSIRPSPPGRDRRRPRLRLAAPGTTPVSPTAVRPAAGSQPGGRDPLLPARRLWGQLIVKVGRTRPQEE